MDLTVAEDLLRNAENFSCVNGAVWNATSGSIGHSSMNITRNYIGKHIMYNMHMCR